MSTLQNRLAFTIALGVTALVVSCEELPETQLKNRAGRGGSATNGGTAGTPSAGGATAGGAPGAGSGAGATAGKGAGGSGGATTGGAGGSGGRGAGAGGTGDVNAGGEAGDMPGGSSGTGGTGGSGGSTGGSSGKGGSAGGSGKGGGAGTGSGGTFSTNPDDFFGDSRCTSEFALCEDFESGELDTDTWTARGAAPEIETVRAARGTHSAHFHTEDNGLQYITATKTFPALKDGYYARIFVWFDSMPTDPDWAHWTISGALEAGADDGAPEIRIGGQWNQNESEDYFGVGTDHGDTGDWTKLDNDPSGNAKPVPVQDWVCLEWMFDGEANETKFWWDGVEHPSLATSETNHGGEDDTVPFILPEFGQVWFGWWLYQADTVPGEFDVWIDEIAIDDQRIGCEH